MSREEMDQLGWDSCDIIWLLATRMSITQASGWRFAVVAGSTGLSRRDHRPARLEQQNDFMRLGKPNLFFGVTAGNMIR